MVLTYINTLKAVAIFGMILLAGAISAAARSANQTERLDEIVNPPSVAAVAKKLKKEHSKLPAGHVPLFTNDNLPTSGAGVVSANPSGFGSQGVFGAKPSPEMIQQAAYINHQLSVARARLEMHKRELVVLQQQLAQNQMQYYPNPSQTLFQEYTRHDINKKTAELNDKKQQIADDQAAVDQLQEKLNQLQQQLSWAGANASGLAEAQNVIPPGVKPGTHAYWRARFQAARQVLAAAKEQERVTEEEMRLLKLQQLRTLDPNIQSQLFAKIDSKGQEEQAAQQAVEQAQQNLQALQEKLKASGAPESWAE